jgi:hypothetical protein
MSASQPEHDEQYPEKELQLDLEVYALSPSDFLLLTLLAVVLLYLLPRQLWRWATRAWRT